MKISYFILSLGILISWGSASLLSVRGSLDGHGQPHHSLGTNMKSGPKPIDITGLKFGKFTAISFSHYGYSGKFKRQFWKFRCDCGIIKLYIKHKITSGQVKSCGCARIQHGAAIHGKIKPEYQIWCRIKQRCLNYNSEDYKYYGERGIEVCDRWINSFQNFYDDMGDRPSNKYSIDRIDNNGNYSPENCRWATRREQCRNMRKNRYITYCGITLILQDWADFIGINQSTFLTYKKNHNCSYEEAINAYFK